MVVTESTVLQILEYLPSDLSFLFFFFFFEDFFDKDLL